MNIGIFFTHDYSLKSWYETGTLDKELKIYRNLSKEYKVNFVFYTYGDSEDIKILPNETGMKVFPIYDKFKRHNNKYVRLLFTFFYPSDKKIHRRYRYNSTTSISWSLGIFNY